MHGLTRQVQAHNRALELDPGCTHAMAQSAGAMLHLGLPHQAAERYTQALAARPGWPPAMLGCAAAQLQCARRDLAEGCFGARPQGLLTSACRSALPACACSGRWVHAWGGRREWHLHLTSLVHGRALSSRHMLRSCACWPPCQLDRAAARGAACAQVRRQTSCWAQPSWRGSARRARAATRPHGSCSATSCCSSTPSRRRPQRCRAAAPPRCTSRGERSVCPVITWVSSVHLCWAACAAAHQGPAARHTRVCVVQVGSAHQVGEGRRQDVRQAAAQPALAGQLLGRLRRRCAGRAHPAQRGRLRRCRRSAPARQQAAQRCGLPAAEAPANGSASTCAAHLAAALAASNSAGWTAPESSGGRSPPAGGCSWPDSTPA